MIEHGIRGGLCQVSHRYAEANNKYMSNSNSNEESSYIIYLDANNLYGQSMSMYLPYGGFQWVKNPESINIFDLEDEDEVGYIFEIDISYPKELHHNHNDLPFLPESILPPQAKYANNLYGQSMSMYLPYGGFQWVKNPESINIFDLEDEDEVGYIFEIDISYPKELHHNHNDLPFLPESILPPQAKYEYLLSIFKDDCHPHLKTHLILDRKGIKGIGLLQQFCKLRVVDLRNNYLFSIGNLSNQTSLTHLYLQGNELRVLTGFRTLVSLEVLYLDFNKIDVIENLGSCPLKILSVKGQILQVGQMIAFEPFTIKSLQKHLKVLNASRNRLLSIKQLSSLKHLEELDVSCNELCDLREFIDNVSEFSSLKKLNVANNRIAKDPSLVKNIVTVCSRLESINGKNISLNMRSWCENMAVNKQYAEDKSFWKECFDESVSCLPTSYRPPMNKDFAKKVYKKIKNED
ncbi:unnamed protein product [Nezara viridula]|uniref:Uncharacterized protein n=1 Tax=Nezara viridula TaxID=85310 RepID=A0A9P0H5K3_NEZVI|nr:unnamed protein product [Nezara viridula]